MIVGLTGGIGSGKSEVSRRFYSLGINVVDADEVARQVVEPQTLALGLIKDHFGDIILCEDGSLNRAELRKIIFSNPTQKRWLENLLHPIIRTEIINQLAMSTAPYTLLSSPLLLETDQHSLVNRILVVDASEELQIKRASARDHNPAQQIKDIMLTQLSRTERCARADDIIVNNGDIEELDSQVKSLHTLYTKLATR